VQGVGFRYTSRKIAAGFQVVGSVQNLADGRVYLVVEGATAELDRFLSALGREMAHSIDRVEQTAGPATGEFSRFEIRHYC
jgi:acylphosphatase